MSSRKIAVEAAFGFGPFDTIAATDWVPLVRTDQANAGKTRALEASWTFGRDNELDEFQAGTGSVLLWNHDRALDPDYASSPYTGDLIPNVPVRIRSQQTPFTVTAIGRTAGTAIVTIDISSAPAPAAGTTIVVDVALAGFDGTFTCTGLFLGIANIITFTQAGADVSNTATTGTVLEVADEFYGFVQDGWQQELDIGTTNCRITLTDLLGVMSGFTLPDVFHQKILEHNPVGFWVLDGGGLADAEQVADQGSGQNDGRLVGEGVTLGDKVVAPGHVPAARFDVEIDAATDLFRYGSVYLGRSPIATSLANALLVATFQARSKPTDDRRVLFTQSVGSNVDLWFSAGGIEAHVHTDGRLIYGVQNTITAASPRTVVDGKPHIMFGASESLGVDTATLSGGGAVSKPISTVNGVGIGGMYGLRPARHWDGWIGTVALYASSATVGLAGREDILEAYGKLDGETADVHIAWALDTLGVPAGRRNLDVGTVIMGPAEPGDRDALEWMREVAATEGGDLYVDHRDGGKVRFTNRYHRFLSSRSTTSQATFTDDPAANPNASIKYTADGLDVAPNGLDGIVNQMTVSWHDGSVVVEDAASIAAYGPRTRQLDTQATTAGQARSAGEWIIANYAQPRSRIRGATASKGTFRDRHDKLQALRLDDRVTFRVHPHKLGTATTTTLYVDGMSHACSGVEWRTTVQFAQGNTFTPWIWGTSAWDTTAYWG